MARAQAASLQTPLLLDAIAASDRRIGPHIGILRRRLPVASIEALPTLLAAAVTIVMFGLTPVTTRIATAQIDGSAVGVFRAVAAGAVAVVILLVFRLPLPRRWADRGLLALSASGGFVAFPLLFSIGTQHTSACHAGLIMAAIPLFTGLVGIAGKRRRPQPQWLAGTAIALAGGALLVVPAACRAATGSSGGPLGDALVLGACFGVAVSSVAGARLTEAIGAWAAIFWSIALAGIVLAPIAAIDAARVSWTQLRPESWAALAHLAFGAGILGWACWFWALARGGVARVSVLLFFQPVLTLVFASLLLSESLSPRMLLGGAAILLGVVVARHSR